MVRGRNKGAERDGRYWTKRRGTSHALRGEVESIAKELVKSGTIQDPGRAKLLETRKAVVAGWLGVATLLDRQGETALAAEVRQFVKSMPPVLTDRERLAAELIRHAKAQRSVQTRHEEEPVRGRTPERTR